MNVAKINAELAALWVVEREEEHGGIGICRLLDAVERNGLALRQGRPCGMALLGVFKELNYAQDYRRTVTAELKSEERKFEVGSRKSEAEPPRQEDAKGREGSADYSAGLVAIGAALTVAQANLKTLTAHAAPAEEVQACRRQVASLEASARRLWETRGEGRGARDEGRGTRGEDLPPRHEDTK